MNGKRAKHLRRIAASVFEDAGIERQNNGKIKVGRTNSGPAFGNYPYPPSARWERIGEFDVLVTTTDELRKQAAEAVQSEIGRDKSDA